MKTCDCYEVIKTRQYMRTLITGLPIGYDVDVGVCNGTKEREICGCGGNEAKCDFYPEIRKKARKAAKVCRLCDGHTGCDNCYYGQVDGKMPHSHCEDCESLLDGVMTGWEPLGDNYCRNCGRKLK